MKQTYKYSQDWFWILNMSKNMSIVKNSDIYS